MNFFKKTFVSLNLTIKQNINNQNVETSMSLYYKIAISTIYFTQNSHHKSIWKFMAILLLTINTFYTLTSIWLFLYFEVCKGFTDFLIINFKIGHYNNLLNIFLYLFLPILIMNYQLIFKNKKYKTIIERYPENYNQKLFYTHFIVSWSLAYFVLIYVLRTAIK